MHDVHERLTENLSAAPWGVQCPNRAGKQREHQSGEKGRTLLTSNDPQREEASVFPMSRREEVFKVGDKVRVKTEITTPRFGWGNVSPRDQSKREGMVVQVLAQQHRLRIDLPEQTNWLALYSEVSVCRPSRPFSLVHPLLSFIEWRRTRRNSTCEVNKDCRASKDGCSPQRKETEDQRQHDECSRPVTSLDEKVKLDKLFSESAKTLSNAQLSRSEDDSQTFQNFTNETCLTCPSRQLKTDDEDGDQSARSGRTRVAKQEERTENRPVSDHGLGAVTRVQKFVARLFSEHLGCCQDRTLDREVSRSEEWQCEDKARLLTNDDVWRESADTRVKSVEWVTIMEDLGELQALLPFNMPIQPTASDFHLWEVKLDVKLPLPSNVFSTSRTRKEERWHFATELSVIV